MEAALLSKDAPGVKNGAASSAGRDVARLLVKGVAVLLTSVLVALTIVVLVPDGNDYADATLLKHRRLAALGPGKIVLVGGSNLAYGVDSAMIEKALGRRVVNMGMNGYFGVRYMLEEVKPNLAASDLVVISLEYDSFYKSADGTGSDLLMIVKTNPEAFSFLSWGQRSDVAEAVPYVAQQKLLRLMRDSARSARASLQPGEPEAPSLFRTINRIESLAGFNAFGDLESHLDVKWAFEREDGSDLTKLPIDEGVIQLLRDFVVYAQAHDVKVVLCYTSLVDYFYKKHEPALQRLHAVLTAASPLVVSHPPDHYVFPEPWFFDTVYHLNRQGRGVRTQRLIDDIKARSESSAERGAALGRSRQAGE